MNRAEDLSCRASGPTSSDGRRGADVSLDDPSVSRRHAEVVSVSGGRLYVTDCATTNGTFVRQDGDWRPVRQTFLEPTDLVRFGDCEMTAGRLDALCPRDAGLPGARGAGDGPPRSRPPEEDAPDPRRGLKRNWTGEVIEKEPPQRRRQR